MDLTLKTPPTSAPVSLDEAKAHMRVDFSDEDTLIASLIEGATAFLDGRDGTLSRALVTQVWELRLRNFEESSETIPLPFPPVQSVAVTYFDTDSVSQTLDPSSYEFQAGDADPCITRKSGADWPETETRRDAVTVTLTCGYGDPTNVPQPIKQAILLLAAHWFENREVIVIGAPVADVPITVDRLIANYRRRPV